jgi:hypothetical protein
MVHVIKSVGHRDCSLASSWAKMKEKQEGSDSAEPSAGRTGRVDYRELPSH